MPDGANVVICGAGITGVSAAYFLAKAGMKDILLIDERPPLTFTSDRSTECYRNWWPDTVMLSLMNRSIDLMEELAVESGNVFHLNRRGYLYVTADESQIPHLSTRSERISGLGAGPLRIHRPEASTYQPAPPEGFHDQPEGADLLLGSTLIQKHFPYISEKAVAALHARRAGWLSAQQLGMYLLETARTLSGISERCGQNAWPGHSGRDRIASQGHDTRHVGSCWTRRTIVNLERSPEPALVG
jgi:glycine/D-amino acid oxidase-like deaminating enzyme